MMLKSTKPNPVRLFFNPELPGRIRKIKIFILTILLGVSRLSVSYSQSGDFDFERIEDNSFLIEEAYNQEEGVIQHISTFQFNLNNSWIYSFTEEWPVNGQKNQLSVTIPVLNGKSTGFGDIALNYRYQAIFKSRLAFAPRFTFSLPTGYYRKSLGTGAPGYQLNLPVSYLLSKKIVTHYNIGLTVVPNARNEDDSEYDLINYNYGLSLILLLSSHFNLMFEAAGNTIVTRSEDTKETVFSSVIVNPGLRYAFNFKSGLQIVPGIAVPLGLGSLQGERWIFLYLSFEHPLRKPIKPE